VAKTQLLSCSQFLRIIRENVGQIWGNYWEFPEKVFQHNTWAFPRNYIQDFLNRDSSLLLPGELLIGHGVTIRSKKVLS